MTICKQHLRRAAVLKQGGFNNRKLLLLYLMSCTVIRRRKEAGGEETGDTYRKVRETQTEVVAEDQSSGDETIKEKVVGIKSEPEFSSSACSLKELPVLLFDFCTPDCDNEDKESCV